MTEDVAGGPSGPAAGRPPERSPKAGRPSGRGATLTAVGRASGVAVAVLAANAIFAHGLWARFDHWGIWDWDFFCALLEAARISVVTYGELPLWNPWLAGGSTLVGHPASSAFAPSFLPVLALGTIPGVKITVLLYLCVAQLGTYRLARALDLGRAASVLAALVFAWGGFFAQHLTHGHLGWIGFAWIPFVLLAFERAVDGPRLPALLATSVFLALAWLDGGPYQYVAVPAFLASRAALIAAERRRAAPLAWLVPCGALAVALAAVELLPTLESVLAHPRPTAGNDHFYGAPFEPGFLQTLHQAFLARGQAHDPEAWMPWALNVGTYVGVLPLVLAAVGLGAAPLRAWPWAVLAAVWLAICLGDALPVNLWSLVHRLPGFDSLQLPMRLRIFALLPLAILAAFGLDRLAARLPDAARAAAVAVVLAAVALDLAWVNGAVFRDAFVVPPIAVERHETLRHELRSPFRETFERTAVHPIWPNWPSAAYPMVRANRGVLLEFRPLSWPRAALPAGHPAHPGDEVWAVRPGTEVVSWERTPNRVSARVRGAGGAVVVNQNHARGWEVARGSALGVIEHNGRLAAVVPAGEHAFTLRYRPPSFVAGAAVSGLAWLGVVGAVTRSSRNARRAAPGRRGSPGA